MSTVYSLSGKHCKFIPISLPETTLGQQAVSVGRQPQGAFPELPERREVLSPWCPQQINLFLTTLYPQLPFALEFYFTYKCKAYSQLRCYILEKPKLRNECSGLLLRRNCHLRGGGKMTEPLRVLVTALTWKLTTIQNSSFRGSNALF